MSKSSCLFRSLSFFLAFCILAIVIIQLPLSNTGRLFLYITLLLIGIIAIWLTTPKRHTVQADSTAAYDGLSFPEEADQMEAAPLDYFEQLVQEALISIPDEFRPYMNNLAIMVEHEPDEDTLRSVGVSDGRRLLGLYHGTPITHLGHSYSMLPECITIYQNAIEEYCHRDPDRIRQQVRATVLHEVAHHFGIDHHDMPGWLK